MLFVIWDAGNYFPRFFIGLFDHNFEKILNEF